MSDFSFLVLAAAALAAVYLVARSLRMPSTYRQRQQQRAKLRRQRALQAAARNVGDDRSPPTSSS